MTPLYLIYNFITLIFLQKMALADAGYSWQITFQDPATPIMEGLLNFHNHIMFFITIIVIFVSWLILRTLTLYAESKNEGIPNKFSHATVLEIVWTLLPAFVLMIIAVPSFALLFSMDEIIDPAITLKIVGHQWYWSYEYSDYCCLGGESLNFDSYMLPETDLGVGCLRLLEVDNRLVLPVNTHIRVLITAADVLHSWAVPSFGIKVDACPGRLNQTSLFIKRAGTYYGQCSEICGVNHGFMPVAVEAVYLKSYILWVAQKLDFLEK